MNNISGSLPLRQRGVRSRIPFVKWAFLLYALSAFCANGQTYGVWRPSLGDWCTLTAPSTSVVYQWGLNGDIPVPGDYDGDHKADYAVWRPNNLYWYVTYSSTGQTVTRQWGLPGDLLVPGDYDGDGKTDFAVWRPSNGTWYVIPSTNPGTGNNPPSQIQQPWGANGDIPVVGDYDGDGRTDYTVWRSSNQTWYIIHSITGQGEAAIWGVPGDKPVSGDFDGDGKTDIAIWRPSTGVWWIVLSATPGNSLQKTLGANGDIPVPGDYDLDGRTDPATWRPADGTFRVLLSSTGQTVTQQWGLTGDIPVFPPPQFSVTASDPAGGLALVPNRPVKEYIRLDGQTIAIENGTR